MALHALGELTSEEQIEWEAMIRAQPQLARQAAEWQGIAAALSRQKVEASSATPAPPVSTLKRLDEIRRGHERQRQRSARFRLPTWTLAGLAAAAAIMIGFFVMREPSVDDGIRRGPVSFPTPTNAPAWHAPATKTGQRQPVFVWKNTPGHAYRLRVEDDKGALLFEADQAQSPLVLESMKPSVAGAQALAAGGSYRAVLFAANADMPLASHPFTVSKGAVLDAAIPAAERVTRMKTLAESGQQADALMLLMRLPENALPPEEFITWKKRLTQP